MTDRALRRVLGAGLPLLAAAAVCGGALGGARARAAEGVIFSGSVFVDQWGFVESKDLLGGRAAAEAREARLHSTSGVAPATSMKVGVDINDDLAFTAKACIGCHGIDMEHVVLDYQPRPWFNVQAGRLAVPFGDFSQRLDPSSHRTGSAPLIYDMGRMAYGARTAMNLGVLPMPYVDTGLLAYGVKWLGSRIQAWYGAYGVSGLRGSNDLDWMVLRTLPYNDNNGEPAWGGRLALSYSADAGAFIGDASLGGSYTAGHYDRDARRAYELWGADATLRFKKLVVRGEYARARTDVDPDATYAFALVDPFFVKEGFYVEAEHPLGNHLDLVYRYDELRRVGAPLSGAPAAMSADSRFTRHTGGLFITPAQNLFMKVSWEYWDTSDFGVFQTYHAGLGGSF